MVRQSTGGILAGGQRWAFVDGDPDEGMSVPSLETLADKELVLVDGGRLVERLYVGVLPDHQGVLPLLRQLLHRRFPALWAPIRDSAQGILL
mgnify:CR=1 FL=1